MRKLLIVSAVTVTSYPATVSTGRHLIGVEDVVVKERKTIDNLTVMFSYAEKYDFAFSAGRYHSVTLGSFVIRVFLFGVRCVWVGWDCEPESMCLTPKAWELAILPITDSKGNHQSRIKTRYWKLSYTYTKEVNEHTWPIRKRWEAICPKC